LLIGLVSFLIFAMGHVTSSQEVPRLSVGRIRIDGRQKIFDGRILISKSSIMMIEPTELLKNFGVLGISFENFFICFLRGSVLLFQLVNVANLKPNVCLIKRLWWRV